MNTKKIKTIGMVVAMDKEITPFLNCVGKCFLDETCGAFKIFGYKTEDKVVYLVRSGIGEIFASSATQLLISEFNVDIILNFGVCGSLTKDVGVYNTILVSGVVHYDFDLSAIDNVGVGEYPGYNSPIIETNKYFFDVCKKVMGDCLVGICASADKFVADSNIKKELNKKYNAVVCDMECAGVLLTANGYNIPTVIIKAVSDGEGGAEEFNACVSKASTLYIKALNELIKEF